MKENESFRVKISDLWLLLDVIKCLEQVEKQILRLTCAPLNELQSNISTMEQGVSTSCNYLESGSGVYKGSDPDLYFCVNTHIRIRCLKGKSGSCFSWFFFLSWDLDRTLLSWSLSSEDFKRCLYIWKMKLSYQYNKIGTVCPGSSDPLEKKM